MPDEDTTPEAVTDETSVADTAEVDDKPAELGDAGKQAIDRMKASRNEERDKRRALEVELTALRAKPVEEGDKPDLDAIREQARAEVRSEVLKDRVADKIAVAAASLFADPNDAAVYLASQVDDFIDNGKVDVEAITDALADLLKKKPYLAAQGGKRFQGTADGGTRKETRPSQLTKANLAGMSPEAIDEARVAGRLDDLMQGKTS